MSPGKCSHQREPAEEVAKSGDGVAASFAQGRKKGRLGGGPLRSPQLRKILETGASKPAPGLKKLRIQTLCPVTPIKQGFVSA